MDILSTSELSQLLGISRNWINRYLRHLGQQRPLKIDDKVNSRTVYYGKGDILAYLNAHATFFRQTEWFDLRECDVDEQWLRDLWKSMKELPEEDRAIVYKRTLNRIIPKDIYLIDEPGYAARQRGFFPWRRAECQIKALEDLSTMERMRGGKSSELVYRDNFKYARVRVMVHGRIWFMAAPEEDHEMMVLIEARGPVAEDTFK